MSARVVFRADASSIIGDGHVMRCLTLAAALREIGYETTLVSHALAASHEERWRALGTIVLQASGPMATDAATLGAECLSSGAKIVVYDGYTYAADYVAAVGAIAPGTVSVAIDDLGDRSLGTAVVVNPNVYGGSVAYSGRLAPSAVELLGPQYALLRREFSAARARVVAPRAGRNVLVSLGGADPLAATEPVLRTLAGLPGVALRVLVGGSNQRRDEIVRLAGTLPAPCEALVDVRDVSTHAEWATVAVVAAGGTCLELACVGLPALTLTCADNQRRVASAFHDAGAMQALGAWPAVDVAGAVETLLGDHDARQRMFANQRALVDGEGAPRVARAIALADLNRCG